MRLEIIASNLISQLCSFIVFATDSYLVPRLEHGTRGQEGMWVTVKAATWKREKIMLAYLPEVIETTGSKLSDQEI